MESGKIDWNQFSISWLMRTKKYTPEKVEITKLKRSISLVGLTTLGLGAMLGPGFYVVAPVAIKFEAGPALFLAFIIAAIASLFSGICFAEIGARIPRSGSSYAYTYVAIGEFWAFKIGWNMILEYVIGTACLARSFSTYIDVFTGGIMTESFEYYFPIGTHFLAPYFDPIALAVVIVLTGILTIGVKESSFVSNVFVAFNIAFSVVISIIGMFYANPSYWNLSTKEVLNATHSLNFGRGGFMPYGFEGVLQTASTAFFLFVGFESIASAAEEVNRPQRNIPISIFACMSISTALYVVMSIVFTMQTPYYNVSYDTLLAGVPSGDIIVATAALTGILSTFVSYMLPATRIVYALAEDGLLFPVFAQVNKELQTPINGTLLIGGLTAFFVSVFDVYQLLRMLSIGTLWAFTMVAISLLVLRYHESVFDADPGNENLLKDAEALNVQPTPDAQLTPDEPKRPNSIALTYLKAIFNFDPYGKRATSFTSTLANIVVLIIVAIAIVIAIFAHIQLTHSMMWWPLVVVVVFGVLMIFFSVRLAMLPQNKSFTTFKVPIVPVIPILAILVNMYLLAVLDLASWIRFLLWMIIGLVLYFSYSIWSSNARHEKGTVLENEQEPNNEAVLADDKTANYGSTATVPEPLDLASPLPS